MKICLCGSTRFIDEYVLTNQLLSLSGHVVYSVSHFKNVPMTDDEKETLDLVHLRKILESDVVVLVGEESTSKPYIGDSTRREVKWAQMHEIDVLAPQDVPDLLAAPYKDRFKVGVLK